MPLNIIRRTRALMIAIQNISCIFRHHRNLHFSTVLFSIPLTTNRRVALQRRIMHIRETMRGRDLASRAQDASSERKRAHLWRYRTRFFVETLPGRSSVVTVAEEIAASVNYRSIEFIISSRARVSQVRISTTCHFLARATRHRLVFREKRAHRVTLRTVKFYRNAKWTRKCAFPARQLRRNSLHKSKPVVRIVLRARFSFEN